VAPRLRGEAARRLLGVARQRGARTFFDTTWDPDGFSAQTRAEVRELLPSVDVFLPNEVEACAIAAGPDGREIKVPAPVTNVADTTGAGDAFNAGLVQALARGEPWHEALATATRFATTVISRPSDDRYTMARKG
jgi:sugar/nucleoside kinase (ribokinase family)